MDHAAKQVSLLKRCRRLRSFLGVVEGLPVGTSAEMETQISATRASLSRTRRYDLNRILNTELLIELP
jgi:hypothetical protein